MFTADLLQNAIQEWGLCVRALKSAHSSVCQVYATFLTGVMMVLVSLSALHHLFLQ